MYVTAYLQLGIDLIFAIAIQGQLLVPHFEKERVRKKWMPGPT